MDKLNKTIELLSKELDGYHLPSEVNKAISVAKDIETLQRAKVILGCHELTEDEVRYRIETDLLDALNSGLSKWGIGRKLSFDEGLDLLTYLQGSVLAVELAPNKLNQ